MEWIDGNLGSRLTMKYPAVYMMEPGARGRDPVDRLLLGRPASRRRRQGRTLCAEHVEPDHLEVDLEERRPLELSRAGQNRERRQEIEVERRLRRLDSRLGQPQRHLSLYRDRRAGRNRRPRGQRIANRRGAVVLPYQPRAVRGRSQHDDRQRLHRAADQRAADGVRRRDEPADRTADGRFGRANPTASRGE